MKNQIKTAPASEPVSLSEARAYIGIVSTNDNCRDDIIATHITAARLWAEQYTRRAFVTQTWELFLDVFTDQISLLGPLQSVTSIKYYDVNGTQQTLSTSVYRADIVGSAINLITGQSWPVTDGRANCIAIEYVSGYLTVPQDIRTAIKFMIDHWERFQKSIDGGRVSTIPYAVTQLLDGYRDMRGYFNSEIQR